MIDPPVVLRTTARITAVIHINCPRDKMREEFPRGIAELMGVLAKQSIEPMGAVFAHHFDIVPGFWNFELGVPVNKVVTPEGRVAAGNWPETKAAVTTYSGPYDGLHGAWGEFAAWIESQGLKSAADLWETYIVGPNASPDPSAWRTELNRPLRE